LPLIPLREVHHAVLSRLRVGQSVDFLTQGFIKTVAPAHELAFARMRPLSFDHAAAQQLREQQQQLQLEQQKKKKKATRGGGGGAASSLAAEFEAVSSEDPTSLQRCVCDQTRGNQLSPISYWQMLQASWHFHTHTRRNFLGSRIRLYFLPIFSRKM
jgi:hypothetical protein